MAREPGPVRKLLTVCLCGCCPGRLVWFSLTWSLELYKQTNARLYRQGQLEPVTITHLVAEGTLDEAVLRALDAKDATQAALIDAVAQEIHTTTTRKELSCM